MNVKLTVLFVFLISLEVKAQTPINSDVIKGWHLKDQKSDGFAGISLNNTYQFLQAKKSTPIIVAVIDSGIDTAHEDLRPILWTNPKEIPGNGIDDDKNGYVDDVHGWNFLGNKDGRNVEKASSEKARVYHRFKDLYVGKNIDTSLLSKSEKVKYATWKSAATDIEPSSENASQLDMLQRILVKLKELDSTFQKNLSKKDFTIEDVENAVFANETAQKAKMVYVNLMKLLPIDKGTKNSFVIQNLQEEAEKMQEDADAKEKAPEDVRGQIVRDNYNDINDKYYGNNDIMGGSSLHGTHVSGIIAAARNNGLGVDGIADNVRIMMIRAVPNGDEYDKDIALAVRYAVDNGAKVINMSFGKSYSPEKAWVDDAFKYAAQHDVLLVHAAGNDHANIDSANNFPSATFLDGTKATNLITVGASSDAAVSQSYTASFSNYGKGVDVFAPGNQIYSTLPGKNNYGFLDGTSMASPVVAGVAALIRSYYPKLTAVQVKTAIEKSVMLCDSTFTTLKPGTEDRVPMNTLCKTAGLLNAFGAIKTADALAKAPVQLPKKTIALPKSSFKKTKPN